MPSKKGQAQTTVRFWSIQIQFVPLPTLIYVAMVRTCIDIYSTTLLRSGSISSMEAGACAAHAFGLADGTIWAMVASLRSYVLQHGVRFAKALRTFTARLISFYLLVLVNYGER